MELSRISREFQHRPPYTRGWDVLGRHLYDTLVDEGFSPRQSDGELLAGLCLRRRFWPDTPRRFTCPLERLHHLFMDPEEPGIRKGDLIPTDYFVGLIAAALGRLPQPVHPDIADTTWLELGMLLNAVGAGRPSHLMTPLQLKWDMEDMLTWHNRDEPPPLLQPELRKWRHWKPRDMKIEEPTTQRALEVHLRARWAERLLAHFAPYAEHVPHMAAILGPSFRQEGHLLGDARFRTLRQHCLAYEGLRKRGFTAIPWREVDVRNLLNNLATAEVTPYKLQQVWNTLKWLSKTFGLLNLDEEHRLKAKKQALEESLADTATKPQRKAVVPSKEVVWALEEGASSLQTVGITRPGAMVPGVEPHKVMDSYILGLARFQLGCSARFNDLQHVHPREIHCTTETVEFAGMANKDSFGSKDTTPSSPTYLPQVQLLWEGLVVRPGSPDTQADSGGTVQSYGFFDIHSQQRLHRCHLPTQHSGPRLEMAERSTLPARS